MILRITKKDAALILAAAVLLVAVVVIGRVVMGDAALLVAPVVCALVILVAILEVYRRLNDQLAEKYQSLQRDRIVDYRQIESFLSLQHFLKPNLPLPGTRGWAASPDLLKKIAELILVEEPRLVVEASSGVSTLVIAYCLKRLGRGRVVSLEHDEKFAAISRDLISSHGLDDIATVVHAPLKEYQCNGAKWLWYDTVGLRIDLPIDLLVIDGPPGAVQKLSRYPALPLLRPYLGERATIIMDDGNRADEKKIVGMWEQEFEHLSAEFLDLAKGAFLIRRRSPAHAIDTQPAFGRPRLRAAAE